MMKSAEEVEREVEASRGELDRTVEALKDKMTPGQIFDEATRAMGGAGQQVMSKFVDQARENPMPLAVMGLVDDIVIDPFDVCYLDSSWREHP